MLNNQIFFFLYNLSQESHLVAQIGLFFSYTFAYGLWVVLCLWAVFVSKKKMYSFSLIFLSTISAWFVTYVIKILIHVPRPFVQLGTVPLHVESGFSFPSQHTAIFAALAVAFFAIDKRMAIFLFICTILIGISRIVVGVHYPIDILGGLVVGTLIGYLYQKLFKKL